MNKKSFMFSFGIMWGNFLCLLILFFPVFTTAENYLPHEGMSILEMEKASSGCMDCHTKTDAVTMHKSEGVVLGCAHCHGGDPEVRAGHLSPGSVRYLEAMNAAHVLPVNKELWKGSANPERTYTELLKETPEFVRFMNPGDLRVAEETCGACHLETVRAVRKSLMTTSAMLWGGASYNNNILPYKNYVLGEGYAKDGKPVQILDNSELTEEDKLKGKLSSLLPLPQWEVVAPGDNFRVFERGGKNIKTQFAEIGNPDPFIRFDEPGKPDVLQSNRGPATGARISLPVLNIHKTRLNDPHLSFMGTNDHPGDYRQSGCTACHVIYANDRSWFSSGPYAKYGNEGKSFSVDPVIPKDERGHPVRHEFTRGIPTSQCMVCHMHQPNMFVNSYLGYTMWDYESDAPFMWPEKQKYPDFEETFKALDKNPEGASVRGKWSDLDFLIKVYEGNDALKDTQFADYHGHGWNFRAIFKKDRKGKLLDRDGEYISPDDPEKFKKAVHLMDIHAERGMHCADCHFGQDSHGDGHIYGEVAQAVEIQCQDCHGTVSEKANLVTSGPASKSHAENKGKNIAEKADLSVMRTPFGDLRFQWRDGKLYQRSNLDPDLEWKVRQVKDTLDPLDSDYNKKSAKAKLTLRLAADQTDPSQCKFEDLDAQVDNLAHSEKDMSCFSCHSSWVTSCAGCHLPIEANWKQKSKHYDGKETRNWATYNPQVARDEMFQLGKHGPAKNGIIVPVRSSSALILSSTDASRQKIYVQQPPTAASGHSSQAFAPHFPHTVRSIETKDCADCHISKANDNNAIMAQLLLLGTNFVNFMGYHVYVATSGKGFEAVQVTEWEEPQAVIGSYLHRYAYPDWFKKHQEGELELQTSHALHDPASGVTNRVQLRGEYLYAVSDKDGFRVYDVAQVSNKGFSQRAFTAPFSPLGHDTHVRTKKATSFALPTNMPIAPFREQLPENLETPLHPIYHYAFITDSEEGLIVVNVDTLADSDPTNNFLERSLTWNENGVLDGAKTITLAGAMAYIGTRESLVVLDLDDPLKPKLISKLSFSNLRSVEVQFRYAFVVDDKGFHVVDVTNPEAPRYISKSFIPFQDARSVYLARTYAYLAAGRDGLVIIDIEKPEEPRIFTTYTANGLINDLYDVKIATTNASLFAYLADGVNGLKVLQLTDPERVPEFYGFSPEVKPKLIAWKKTSGSARYISKPLDRDRAVDETGHQVSIFGRIGSRPFNLEEMRKMFLNSNGHSYHVH
ncbi:MAG TPA: hypothetical protein PKA63_02555 [Oligoflexia bacterium]|nr:hypothetical protein [Oligoflexia bacterium]HMP47533.1 hypothetical protein [Oligoflexia bacterium]